ncbi:MAG: DUF2891 domain-containing protein [Chitinophagaceae bacterium]|nr:DUF2891 domain-containing protein [Chitinophagaceae bacterium]
MKIFFCLLFLFCSTGNIFSQVHFKKSNNQFTLTTEGASHLASLPLKCILQQFPYKTGVVFKDSSLIKNPRTYHPVFYGCFDWHSSAHGHWMLIRLLRLFPSMPQADTIRSILKQQLTASNIRGEMKLFEQKENKSFERTYGWAWILQMQKELVEWNDSLAKDLSANLKPLSDLFSKLYIEYLGKLLYPIRVGEHSNLAFGLRLAWDYAGATSNDSLKMHIKNAAIRFYKNDKGCPLEWEPGGTDFLSPCLEEADLMWRILPRGEYEPWLKKFLPRLFESKIPLKPGEVADRTDGRLVHLDGLNFSRAWCLYGIADHIKTNREKVLEQANIHMSAALPHVASGDYMGEHWLASFAVYAITINQH